MDQLLISRQQLIKKAIGCHQQFTSAFIPVCVVSFFVFSLTTGEALSG
jgi:hypothetical protein